DIIACGFDPERTFIFKNSDYYGKMYRFVTEIERMTTVTKLKAMYGFTDSTNCGYMAFPPKQAAPSFCAAFPNILPGILNASKKNKSKQPLCIVPCGMEQDTYFCLARDVADRLKMPKPTELIGQFIPALQGAGSKMSASKGASALYLKDTPKQVFMEDDEELEKLKVDYAAGRLMTGEVKNVLIAILQDLIKAHNDRKAEITDDVVRAYMQERMLESVGAVAIKAPEPEVETVEAVEAVTAAVAEMEVKAE
ncbi:tryptophan-tRNA ligase, partial [Kipferlia bialata]